MKAMIRIGHARIRVVACGINPVDAKYCVGDKFPLWTGSGKDSLGQRFSNGSGVGLDFAGVVVAVGGAAGANAANNRGNDDLNP